MKKILFVLAGLLLGLSASQAQERYSSGGHNSKPKNNASGFDPQRIVIGGGLSLGFANSTFMAGISPMVGYKLTNNLLAGVSLGYLYYRDGKYKEYYNTTTNRFEISALQSSMVSPGAWVRYNIFNQFFVQVQYEHHFSNTRWTDAARIAGGSGKEKVSIRYDLPSLLVGAGYRLPVSERISMYIGLYYDVLQNQTIKTVTSSNGWYQGTVASPYYGSIQPVIGFGIGF
ncbi:hypothetical protein [Edaphocola flava]|jgi:hypothetical protein|uniref:hypothetical protein n=1 Tax=Edaphocola flava TaxID=2499629 RepID=UPI00100B4BB3|nr:hypothetical protein [Edaphocola flava]